MTKYSIAGIVAAVIIIGVSSFVYLQPVDEDSEKTELEFDIEKLGEEGSLAEQIILSCEDDVHCAVDALHDVATKEEQSVVLTAFDDLVSLYETKYRCHQIGHHLGMWLYAYIGDIADSLAHAKMICGGSIYHGVIQNYLAVEHFSDKDLSEIDFAEICPEIKGHPYSIDRWQCLHGIGHGLTIFFDSDVFKAVQICERFEPGWEQISCSKGVFMQNVVTNFETGGGEFDDDDLYYPCNKVESKWAPPCYHYHPTYILLKNDRLLGESYKDCDNILPEEFVKYCYHGMGRQLERNIAGKIEHALKLCRFGLNTDYHKDCFRGMVMTIVNVNTNPKGGFAFCKDLPQEFKAECYDAVGRWVIMLHPSDEGRTVECLKAENSEYFDICMDASLESLKLF